MGAEKGWMAAEREGVERKGVGEQKVEDGGREASGTGCGVVGVRKQHLESRREKAAPCSEQHSIRFPNLTLRALREIGTPRMNSRARSSPKV